MCDEEKMLGSIGRGLGLASMAGQSEDQAEPRIFKNQFVQKSGELIRIIENEIDRLQWLKDQLIGNRKEFIDPPNPMNDLLRENHHLGEAIHLERKAKEAALKHAEQVERELNRQNQRRKTSKRSK